MFRVSFVVLALAAGLALNGCSKCSSTQNEAPTMDATAAAPAETQPAEGQEDGEQVAPAETTEGQPADAHGSEEGSGH